MDNKHIIKVLKETIGRLEGVETGKLITNIAKKTKDLKSVSLEDQLLLGAMLGSVLHKDYCEGRKLDKPLENGLENDPRVKVLNQELDQQFVKDVLIGKIPTSDTLYIEGGKVYMDIANTSFENLSPYWQYDNFMAGACAARSVITNWDGLMHPNPEVREYVKVGVANAIHESWIGRGNVEAWNSDLATAYINLTPSEQEKDLKHYVMGSKLVDWLEREISNVDENITGSGFDPN